MDRRTEKQVKVKMRIEENRIRDLRRKLKRGKEENNNRESDVINGKDMLPHA